MKKTKKLPLAQKSPYNTNLASEFHVLSVLHRLGINANLTLGNKKSVDIAVIRGAGDTVTIDVKGLAGKTGWPMDNVKANRQGHYIVLVCYLGHISDPTKSPEVYVVPSTEINTLIYNAPGGRRLVTLSKMRGEGKKFRDCWKLIA